MNDAFSKAFEILKAGGKPWREFLRYAEEEERKAQEIQDAEDVHVRAWMTDLQGAGTHTYGGPVDEVWAEATESKRDIWRRSYRANRDHFAKVHEARRAPHHVMRYCHDEPPRDTRWKDSGGNRWEYDQEVGGWRSVDGYGVYLWGSIGECYWETFPWTQIPD